MPRVPQVTTRMRTSLVANVADDEPLVESLTARETQVLELVADGLPNKLDRQRTRRE